MSAPPTIDIVIHLLPSCSSACYVSAGSQCQAWKTQKECRQRSSIPFLQFLIPQSRQCCPSRTVKMAFRGRGGFTSLSLESSFSNFRSTTHSTSHSNGETDDDPSSSTESPSRTQIKSPDSTGGSNVDFAEATLNSHNSPDSTGGNDHGSEGASALRGPDVHLNGNMPENTIEQSTGSDPGDNPVVGICLSCQLGFLVTQDSLCFQCTGPLLYVSANMARSTPLDCIIHTDRITRGLAALAEEEQDDEATNTASNVPLIETREKANTDS